MTSTRELIEATFGLQAADFDAATVRSTRQLLLDHVGVAANGSRTDSAVVFRKSMGRLSAGGQALLPVIGAHQLAPALQAAMANALASHAIEYDDVHNGSSLHPGVVIYPVAMAAAALVGATDEAILRGIVVGYEVMCRVGRAANPPSHYARHFHPTGTVGTIGAAAAAAAVMGLNVDQAVSAVGIAASMASGSMQFLVDGAWTKRLHPALAARNGIEAAFLAADGYTGTLDGVSGARGFLAAYSNEPHPEVLLEDWGSRPLEIVATSVKAHTCCRYNQGGIDAVLALRREHSLTPADIAEVTVGVPTVAVDIVLEPQDEKRRPQSVVAAQFSLCFGVAAALRFGRAGLDEYVQDTLFDPVMTQLMDRVSYEVDPAIDAVYPNEWRAWVRVRTVDGRVLTHSVREPKGDPGNPLTDSELEAKFRSLTDTIFVPDVQDRVVSIVSRFGEPGTFEALRGSI